MRFIDSVRSLLYHRPDEQPAHPKPDQPDPVHIAACALLLEIAYADGEFAPSERAHLESVLARQFGLDSAAGSHLIEFAEAE